MNFFNIITMNSHSSRTSLGIAMNIKTPLASERFLLLTIRQKKFAIDFGKGTLYMDMLNHLDIHEI